MTHEIVDIIGNILLCSVMIIICAPGLIALCEEYELNKAMKKIEKEWKEEQRERMASK